MPDIFCAVGDEFKSRLNKTESALADSREVVVTLSNKERD
jgi:hypothetical protein